MSRTAAPAAGSSSVVRYDLARLRGFSDCVFAVSITLQAVVAAMPALSSTDAEVNRFLSGEIVGYGAYIATFLVVGYVWLQHHRIFGLLRRVDGWMVAANFGVLVCVVVLPYFGRLSADFREFSLPHVVVGVDVAVIGLLLGFVVHRARRAEAFSPVVPERAVRILAWRCRALTFAFGIAGVLSILDPRFMGLGWPLLIVGALAIRRLLGRIDEADVSSLDDEVEIDADESPVAVSGRQNAAIGRITGFSDNVYAFAITAVALQLRIPAREAVTSNHELIEQLRATADPLLSGYLVGFVVIAMFWVAHCRYFLLIVRHGTSLPAVNLTHLMTLAVLPFVSLLYSDFVLPTTTVLYSVVAGLTALSLSAVYLYADRAGLLVDGWSRHERDRTRLAAAIMPTAFLFSVPVAWFAPRFAMVVWIAAGVSNRRIVRARTRDRAGAEVEEPVAS